MSREREKEPEGMRERERVSERKRGRHSKLMGRKRDIMVWNE